MISQVIFNNIFNRVLDRILKDDVPVNNMQAPEVAAAAANAIAPVIENATNSEPWYRSRIYLGLIVAGIGVVGSRFGFVIPDTEVENIVTLILNGAEVIGLLIATWGRVVGATAKPLGK